MNHNSFFTMCETSYTQKTTLATVIERWKWHFQNMNDIERNTCQGFIHENNNFKVKIRKWYSRKNERGTFERKGVQNLHLEKLTEIEVQPQLKVRDWQWKCTLTIEIGWKLRKHYLDGPRYAYSSLHKRILSWNCKLNMCIQVTSILRNQKEDLNTVNFDSE